MAEPKLRIDKVRKSYGNVHALRETSLDLPPGEFLTLLGPSGSGKTTLLMMVAGLVLPDAGDIWIDRRQVTHAPVHHRDIGMVFQNYALFPHLTVAENIAFPLRMRRMAQADIAAKVKRILEIVRLPHVAERLPRELSGGQQQRIALARCAVYEPPIILMDEPLGALDKKLRDEMQLEIKRIHKELGTTILFVTHDQEEAMSMSDRICLMNEGRIEQIGSPQDLYFKPVSVFAADFLGGSNFLAMRAESVNGSGVALASPDGRKYQAASAAAGVTAGSAVSAMVRPEHFELLANGTAADNVIEGRLLRTIMVGGVSRHYVELADGATVTATQLTTGFPARANPGDPVRLGWRREHTVVLPAREAA